jgi:hypothetical protein
MSLKLVSMTKTQTAEEISSLVSTAILNPEGALSTGINVLCLCLRFDMLLTEVNILMKKDRC